MPQSILSCKPEVENYRGRGKESHNYSLYILSVSLCPLDSDCLTDHLKHNSQPVWRSCQHLFHHSRCQILKQDRCRNYSRGWLVLSCCSVNEMVCLLDSCWNSSALLIFLGMLSLTEVKGYAQSYSKLFHTCPYHVYWGNWLFRYNLFSVVLMKCYFTLLM